MKIFKRIKNYLAYKKFIWQAYHSEENCWRVWYAHAQTKSGRVSLGQAKILARAFPEIGIIKLDMNYGGNKYGFEGVYESEKEYYVDKNALWRKREC